MSKSRDFFKEKGFDIQAERIELYRELQSIEDAASHLDPKDATQAILTAKTSRIRLLSDMQDSIYSEEKLEIAAEATRKQSDNSNVKFFVPSFREIKDANGKIRLIPVETNTDTMKLIE